MPKQRPWVGFADMAEQYGPVISLSVLGKRIIVLNSVETLVDGLGKRELAGRPHLVVAGELMDFNRTMVLVPDGPEHKAHRRLSHIALNPSAVQAFTKIQTESIRRCIERLATTPDYDKEIRVAVARSIVEMVYGIKIEGIDDPFVVCADTVFEALGDALVPGRYLADVIPMLKLIPSWFPGAHFKREAAQVRKELDTMCDFPFSLVKEAMASGTAPYSFVSSLLDGVKSGSIQGVPEEFISNVAGTLYGGGVDTTYSTILTFLLAASINPRVQAKAQEEIDRVIGKERLPVFEDRASLPYVRAVVQEAMRFYPTAPVGVARLATKDTVIGGYFVPKDSVVIPNAWAVSRDPGSSGLPADEFHPERFFNASPPPDPSVYAFGVGRRSCVGQTVGENFVFIMIASLLASYTILPAQDEEGRDIKPKLAWLDTTLTRPEPFGCRFVPRA
ncbi:cytochrome P450 [Exidia glandulosa HHB12029]|uniref:Cytochrome P450 n=1 Tax=Exidia glandulosa HHB12029 TaxID=1314781 RepID=A0A165DX75_EXIGL|nr:cytochrome P450 [Exidia glandulosa HHB12029]